GRIAWDQDAQRVDDAALDIELAGRAERRLLVEAADLLPVGQAEAGRAEPVGAVRRALGALRWRGEHTEQAVVAEAGAGWPHRAVADEAALADVVFGDFPAAAVRAPAADETAVGEEHAVACVDHLRHEA